MRPRGHAKAGVADRENRKPSRAERLLAFPTRVYPKGAAAAAFGLDIRKD
jgi:hypothetical protein